MNYVMKTTGCWRCKPIKHCSREELFCIINDNISKIASLTAEIESLRKSAFQNNRCVSGSYSWLDGWRS